MFLSVGVGALSAGFLSMIYTSAKLSKWRRVEGVAVDLVKSRDLDGGSITPIVRFTKIEDQSIVTFQDRVSVPMPHKIGQRVAVVYDPRKPSRASIAGWRPYFFTFIFVFSGCVLLGLSAVQP